MAQTVVLGRTSGDGHFTEKCCSFLRERFASPHVLLTSSCTSALELSALACEIGPGDEVIVPSFSYVSTANAFLLRGADIRFVDVLPDTLTLDVSMVEKAISDRTRIIVPVHYAGVSCNMDDLLDTANRHGIFLIEDAAQALGFLLNSEDEREALRLFLAENRVMAVVHYQPLHASPMGLSMGYAPADFPVSVDVASRLLRLPMYFEITEKEQERVCQLVSGYFS